MVKYLHCFDAGFSLDDTGVAILPVVQDGLFVLLDDVDRRRGLW